MDIDAFKNSLQQAAPPFDFSPPLQALWRDVKGDWDGAHSAAQDDDSREAAWVHAYLHRKEGDISNAGYWYRRAGKPVAEGTLEEEWNEIAAELLAISAP